MLKVTPAVAATLHNIPILNTGDVPIATVPRSEAQKLLRGSAELRQLNAAIVAELLGGESK
jgi:hypothetical protein